MTGEPASTRRVGPRLVAGLFVVLFAALALGYMIFLRAGYVPVFAEVRPADASAIVAQLETKKIAYRLDDGGTTILVPSDQADMARLAVAGSDVALRGGVGFELFNKSDMGLTDFTQRINYQRALQGELERSIMMIDEIETARVHLAMPERSIFRSERSSAKAAVELVIKPGRPFDASRVAGVQRLVAFAVPDLAAADVVVLDGNGRILSQGGDDDSYLTPEAEEQRSMQGYYRARARAALQQALPGVQTDVQVLALDRSAGSDLTGREPAAADANARPARNFRLRVIVITPAPLNTEEVELARTAVAAAVALDPAAGDTLLFQVSRAIAPTAPAPSTLSAVAPGTDAAAAGAAEPASWYVWLAGGILLSIAAGVLLRLGRDRTRLSAIEREAMLDRVRAALHQTEASRADA